MKQSIEDQYRELIQEFNRLPYSNRYDLSGDEAIRLTHEAMINPFVTIGYTWMKGFLAGIRYAQRHQKRAENNDRDPKCDPFHEKSA